MLASGVRFKKKVVIISGAVITGLLAFVRTSSSFYNDDDDDDPKKLKRLKDATKGCGIVAMIVEAGKVALQLTME